MTRPPTAAPSPLTAAVTVRRPGSIEALPQPPGAHVGAVEPTGTVRRSPGAKARTARVAS